MTKQENAKTAYILAKEIDGERSQCCDYDCEMLCKLVGLEAEWEAADKETCDDVLDEAIERGFMGYSPLWGY